MYCHDLALRFDHYELVWSCFHNTGDIEDQNKQLWRMVQKKITTDHYLKVNRVRLVSQFLSSDAFISLGLHSQVEYRSNSSLELDKTMLT